MGVNMEEVGIGCYGGIGLPDSIAARTVEAEWARDRACRALRSNETGGNTLYFGGPHQPQAEASAAAKPMRMRLPYPDRKNQ